MGYYLIFWDSLLILCFVEGVWVAGGFVIHCTNERPISGRHKFLEMS